MLAWWRRLPPNVQGALWLVSGGFIFTSTGVMIRLLSEQIDSVQTAFFRAVIGLVLLLPMILTGRVVPWHSKRLAGHFWRTFMGTVSMVLGFYAVSMLPLADALAARQFQRCSGLDWFSEGWVAPAPHLDEPLYVATLIRPPMVNLAAPKALRSSA